MGKNSNASEHYGANCLDKANSYSKIPMNQRLYESITNSDENSCAICMNQKPNITFILCDHVATCEEYSTRVQICPISQKKIDERKIFSIFLLLI
jgi:hypothetical protein